MEISGQYLSYNEYKGLGGTLDQTPFNLLEYNARKKIDEKTFGRLQDLEQQPEEVKLCIFQLINVINNYSNNDINKSISSESIDGYSISYTNPNKTITEAKNSELDDIINTYLSNTIVNEVPVLFRGVK